MHGVLLLSTPNKVNPWSFTHQVLEFRIEYTRGTFTPFTLQYNTRLITWYNNCEHRSYKSGYGISQRIRYVILFGRRVFVWKKWCRERQGLTNPNPDPASRLNDKGIPQSSTLNSRVFVVCTIPTWRGQHLGLSPQFSNCTYCNTLSCVKKVKKNPAPQFLYWKST